MSSYKNKDLYKMMLLVEDASWQQFDSLNVIKLEKLRDLVKTNFSAIMTSLEKLKEKDLLKNAIPNFLEKNKDYIRAINLTEKIKGNLKGAQDALNTWFNANGIGKVLKILANDDKNNEEQQKAASELESFFDELRHHFDSNTDPKVYNQLLNLLRKLPTETVIRLDEFFKI